MCVFGRFKRMICTMGGMREMETRVGMCRMDTYIYGWKGIIAFGPGLILF